MERRGQPMVYGYRYRQGLLERKSRSRSPLPSIGDALRPDTIHAADVGVMHPAFDGGRSDRQGGHRHQHPGRLVHPKRLAPVIWETTCPQIGQTTYTCRKLHDFGSTIAHELGHIWRLYHPNQVSGTANALAECQVVDGNGDPLWRDTMCPSDSVNPGSLVENEYRTERRTIDVWDRESHRLIYVRH